MGRGGNIQISHSVSLGKITNNKDNIQSRSEIAHQAALEKKQQEAKLNKRDLHLTTNASEAYKPFADRQQAISLALDSSGSMHGPPLEELETVVFNLGLNKDKTSLSSFLYSGSAKKLDALVVTDKNGSDYNAIKKAPMGGTPTGLAVELQRKHLKSSTAKSKKLVIFTDGQPNDNPSNIKSNDQIKKAQQEGAEVTVICYTQGADAQPLLEKYFKDADKSFL
jgi:uncharacterized protein YegL